MVPDWVLREAEKRCGWDAGIAKPIHYECNGVFSALCDMILAHEQPPVDPIEAAAREGCARHYGGAFSGEYRDGIYEVGHDTQLDCAIAAIKVWIERGEGK